MSTNSTTISLAKAFRAVAMALHELHLAYETEEGMTAHVVNALRKVVGENLERPEFITDDASSETFEALVDELEALIERDTAMAKCVTPRGHLARGRLGRKGGGSNLVTPVGAAAPGRRDKGVHSLQEPQGPLGGEGV